MEDQKGHSFTIFKLTWLFVISVPSYYDYFSVLFLHFVSIFNYEKHSVNNSTVNRFSELEVSSFYVRMNWIGLCMCELLHAVEFFG